MLARPWLVTCLLATFSFTSVRIPFTGRDLRGVPLASGVYFYRVTASGTTVTHKMVIAR